MPRSVEQLLEDMKKNISDIEEYKKSNKPINPNEILELIGKGLLELGSMYSGGWAGKILIALARIIPKIKLG